MAGSAKPKLLYLVLCDGISTEPDTGKKTLLGVFDRLIAKALPGNYPSMTIVTGLEGGVAPYEVSIAILGPTEQRVFCSPTVAVAPKAPYQREDIILQVNGLPLSGPGRYVIQILIGGEPIGSYPLFVELLQAATTKVSER